MLCYSMLHDMCYCYCYCYLAGCVGQPGDALVSPGFRRQTELQGENPSVEGSQVVPYCYCYCYFYCYCYCYSYCYFYCYFFYGSQVLPFLATWHHLQYRPGLNWIFQICFQNGCILPVKAFLARVLVCVIIRTHLEREISLDNDNHLITRDHFKV